MDTPTCCTAAPAPAPRDCDSLCAELSPALRYDLGLADTRAPRERPATVSLRGEFDLFWW